MRTFIAIELEKESKDVVYKAQSRLRKKLKGVKWVEYENFHITLKFLGETDEKKLEGVKRVLKEIGAQVKKFEISGGDFGAFPSPRRARVLFFGIDEGKTDILRLFEKLERKLGNLGFERDNKPYHPHVTVGRGKRRFFEVNDFLGLKAPFKQKVKSVTLFKSTLTPDGPIYTVIMRGELG